MTQSGPELKKRRFLPVVSALVCSVLLAVLWLLIFASCNRSDGPGRYGRMYHPTPATIAPTPAT